MPMNRLRKIFATLVLAVSPGASASNDLLEFSTSMDFDEFEVVVEHLRRTDAMFAEEIARAIAEFKAAEDVGATWRRELANGWGHIALEREDDYALTIAVFTGSPLHERLNAAYQSAVAELGI